MRGEPDDTLLRMAQQEGWTLVTYDQRSIRPLLKQWSAAGQSHAGVVFVDQRTCAPDDYGGLARSLSALWERMHDADWTNVVVYLERIER